MLGNLFFWLFCIILVRLDLGSILGGLSQQNNQNNNNNQNKDPLGSLINQGIQLVATNPDIQQGILNAAGVPIKVPKPNRPNQVTTTTQGMHFCNRIDCNWVSYVGLHRL